MKRILHIEGMHCIRCAGKVEGALHDLGLNACVDLEKKICTVEGEADPAAIRQAVEGKGFELFSMEEA